MTESSLEALREELWNAQDEARQAIASLEESAKRVAALESQCGQVDADQIRILEDQIEALTAKLKKAEEGSTSPVSLSSLDLGSPKTQSDDEYIVVEQQSPDDLQKKLMEREGEIRKALAHAKRLEELYNAAEERTLSFEQQVKVLEATMLAKFDDAHALLEKVKELEELLTAGQIQIAALEEKAKSTDEAQKKVEYEKVLFLETEDQLVKRFEKAHDDAERYRNMISQLETSVKSAEEKASHAEKSLEVASERNQELESEIADLTRQLQQINTERSIKADSLEQELQMYKCREGKKIEDDARSVDEKIIVHEASTNSAMADRTINGFHEELKSLKANVAAHVMQSEQLVTENETLKSQCYMHACEAAERQEHLLDRNELLEARVAELETETCPQLKTQIQELEALVGEQSLELQDSKRMEHTLLNQIAELKEQVDVLEEKLKASDAENVSFKEEIDVLVKIKSDLEGKVNEEIVSAQVSNPEAVLWMDKDVSKVTEQNNEIQSLHAVIAKLQKDKAEAKEGICLLNSTLFDQRADFMMRVHTVEQSLMLCEAENSVLGDEIDNLQKSKSDLERRAADEKQDIIRKNENLRSEIEVLKIQLQNNETHAESPVKKSFREVSLEGEARSLRAKLEEFQTLKAQISEMSSLRTQLAKAHCNLRAAEKREHEKNLELVQEQRKFASSQEVVCSLQSTLLNQNAELKEQVDFVEDNLMKSEADNIFLKEKIDDLVKSKSSHDGQLTDEIFMEQASVSLKQADAQPLETKQKTRKRKNKKSGKTFISEEAIQSAEAAISNEVFQPVEGADSSRLIVVSLLALVLVIGVIWLYLC